MAIYPILRRPVRHAILVVTSAVALVACSAVGSEEPGVSVVEETLTSVDCRSLAGSVWESVEEHEIGMNRDGELVYGQWSLTFKFQSVVWLYSDVKDTLQYECVDGAVSAKDDVERQPEFAGRLLNRDEATQLEWDGLLYEPVSLAEPFPLPDPDDVAPQSAEEALLFGVGVVQTLLAGDADGWRALTAETLVAFGTRRLWPPVRSTPRQLQIRSRTAPTTPASRWMTTSLNTSRR